MANDKDNDTKETENFFDKNGMEVAYNTVEVGQTYPLYGMITKFIDETPGAVVVELNHNIEAKMSLDDIEKINLIKERAFEPGIFVSTVVSINPRVVVECVTVVFGKRPNHQVQ